MRFKMVMNAVLVAVGYVLVEVLERMYSLSSEITLGIAVLLMVFPRIPRMFRWLGVGMFVANDYIQGTVSGLVNNFVPAGGGNQ